MDRTEDFFAAFTRHIGFGDTAQVLKKRTTLPFNRTADDILGAIRAINGNIDSVKDPFVGRSELMLTRSESMNDAERDEFVRDTEFEINRVEQLIHDVADAINSGEVEAKGDIRLHIGEALKTLEKMLTDTKKSLSYLKIQRAAVKRHIVASQPTRIGSSASKPTTKPPDSPFYKMLQQEQDTVRSELLELNSQYDKAEASLEEIVEMIGSFNEIVTEQTDLIHQITNNVEEALENVSQGKSEVDKAAEKAQYQHLTLSILIIVMGIWLLLS